MFSKREDRVNREMTPRNCKFPGCDVEFLGIGKTKYCPLHQQSRFRSELYGRKPGETAVFDSDGQWIPVEEINAKIKHQHQITTEIECVCALEGCGETFRILLIPNIYTYPMHCPRHRNEFQKNFHIKQQKAKKALEDQATNNPE